MADARDASLRARIAASAPDQRREQAILHDVHLLEAALATDRTVASIDDEACGLYRAVSRSVRVLKRVVWVNPVTDSGRVIRWLEGETESEAGWQIGA